MIPLHCLWAKSNNRTRDQFECDVTGFVFVLVSFRNFTDTVWLLFQSFFTLKGEWAGIRLKLDIQGQSSGKILDVDEQGVGSLENWTIFMDVICVSSFIHV